MSNNEVTNKLILNAATNGLVDDVWEMYRDLIVKCKDKGMTVDDIIDMFNKRIKPKS